MKHSQIWNSEKFIIVSWVHWLGIKIEKGLRMGTMIEGLMWFISLTIKNKLQITWLWLKKFRWNCKLHDGRGVFVAIPVVLCPG